MPRPIRLDPPNARHHVMNRGARREPIFLTDQDCLSFLDLLARCADLFALRVHAYALMSNHYHLLVTSPRGNLGEAIGFLQSRFSRKQKEVYRWDGPLFRGRYKNRVVDEAPYWRHLLAYVHLNPVTAHLVGQPEDAIWTSHRAYLGLERKPDWLETGELLKQFGSREKLRQYVYAVQVGRERGPEGFDPARLWRRDASLPLRPEPPPAPLRDTEQALAEVGAVTGRSREEVEQPTLGPGGNRARLLAMWWMREGAGMGTNAIALHFGLDPAAVSRALRRAEKLRLAEFDGWKAALVGDGRRQLPIVGR